VSDHATTDPMRSPVRKVLRYGQRALNCVSSAQLVADIAGMRDVFDTERAQKASRMWAGLGLVAATSRHVAIGDLDASCQEVGRRQPHKQAVIDLASVTYQACTMSSRLILVGSAFDDDPDTIARVRLRHEFDHVVQVPGVLLKVVRHVTRTEGVMVEALLGNDLALDDYAAELQKLEVERREALVARDRALSAQLGLVNQAISEGDETKGGIAAKLVSKCALCCGSSAKDVAQPETP
jgi:hypothetical protein